MSTGRNTDLTMADAPLPMTTVAGNVLDMIPASGNPGSSGDQRGETMESSPGESREP
jgi:hypothetical protein